MVKYLYKVSQEVQMRKISILVILCLTCFLTACSKTPENTVSEKNTSDTSVPEENSKNEPDEIDCEKTPTVPEEEEPLTSSEAISSEEYENFKATAEAKDAEGFSAFDDFSDTLGKDFTGTWYDPESGEAIRLTDQGAYVYITFLQLYGDTPYEWEVIDRSDRGLCPELAIYISGRDAGPLAYYIAGVRDDYFWCNSQAQIFYRQ